MEKILILKDKKTNLLQHFFFSKIYLHNEIVDEANINRPHKNKNNKKIENISGNFINLQEEFESENIASKFADEYISEYLNEIPNYFSESKSYNFLYWDLKKYLSIEISKYLKAIYLADKIVEKYNLKDKKIYLEFEDIDIKIFNNLKRKVKCPYRLTVFNLIKLYIRYFYRNIFNIFYILIIPELKFFLCKKKNVITKNHFKIGHNIFFDQKFDNWCGSPDFYLKNQDYDNDDVLFLSNSRINIFDSKNYRRWVSDLKKSNYHLIDLNNISSFITKKNYLNKIYYKISDMRFFFFKNPRILGILNINCANILSQYMTWLIFFELFSIKYFVTSMIFGENISNYLQSKYSNSTNFVYFSTSGNLLKKKIYPTKTEFIQYSFARFDNFFGNKISYKQFLEWENDFKNFIETGNLTTPFILASNKSKILKKLNFKNNKKLVTFFDGTIGKRGIQSTEGYVEYLKSATYIVNKDNTLNYVFKSKSTFEKIYLTLGKEYSNIFEILLNNKNIIFFDDKKLLDLDLQSHELISASDVCIFTPMSSLAYDALCAKKSSLIFDPDKIYENNNHVFTMSKLIYSQTQNELYNLLNYWKKDGNLKMNEISEEIVMPKIDKYSDQESIVRFLSNFK